jgi:uncharacterized cupin superfamily protein
MINIRRPNSDELQQLNVSNWQIHHEPVESRERIFDQDQTLYIQSGEVTVMHSGGQVRLSAGDLVDIPAGMSCYWRVLRPMENRSPI